MNCVDRLLQRILLAVLRDDPPNGVVHHPRRWRIGWHGPESGDELDGSWGANPPASTKNDRESSESDT